MASKTLIARFLGLFYRKPGELAEATAPGEKPAASAKTVAESPVPVKPFQGWLRIREALTRKLQVELGVIPVALLLLGWILLTLGEPEYRVISPLILPSPQEVVGAFHSLWFEAELTRSLLASAIRVVCGFAIALAVAFPAGLLMGTFTKIKALFAPTTVFLSYLPIPALVPLTLSLFGTDELQKIMFLGLAFLIYLLPLFVRAVEEVDNVYLQTAYTMGAGRWQMLTKVLFPISFPQVINAMRLGFGVGWTYIILAEMVAAERGLGQIIIVAQRRGPREHIYLVLVVIVLLAYLTDKMWEQLHRALFPYLRAR